MNRVSNFLKKTVLYRKTVTGAPLIKNTSSNILKEILDNSTPINPAHILKTKRTKLKIPSLYNLNSY